MHKMDKAEQFTFIVKGKVYSPIVCEQGHTFPTVKWVSVFFLGVFLLNAEGYLFFYGQVEKRS
jgi:hypothetical protein